MLLHMIEEHASGVLGFYRSVPDEVSLFRKSIGHNHDISADLAGGLGFAPWQVNNEIHSDIFLFCHQYT
jgi:hypothetical protein